MIEVYDLECLRNLFTYTGYDYKNDKWYQFVICPWRNDTNALMEHLKTLKLMIGYNNLAYDSPLLHHLLRHYNEYRYWDGNKLAQQLYKKSQEIIESDFSELGNKNTIIKQIDLYKIWHYNNPARKSSLKDLEFAMRMEDIEEMPIHHSTFCQEGDDVKVLNYNKWDVYATYLFLEITLGRTNLPLYQGKNKIQLRTNLSKKFNFDCINLPDVRIGEQLMLTLYSRETNQDIYKVKKLGTVRDSIKLKDCIPYWEDIKSKEFLEFKHELEITSVSGSKGEFQKSIRFHNIDFDFGLGGTHGCVSPGIYKTDDKFQIIDYDVSSLYPSIAKSLNLYPEHLGPEFTKLYSQFIEARITEKHKPKDERDNVLIEGYKLLLNGTYGKSKEETSFMFDMLYTFKTTIAGQVFIAMWAEKLTSICPDLQFIQINTDGISVKVPKTYITALREGNEELTKLTGLGIEEVLYDKMIIRDVNSYIGVYSDSTPDHEHLKLKGCFEIDKELHKDSSMRIVPIALKEYFVNNIPIKQTIMNHKDIFDFCLRLKTNSKSTPIFRHISDNKIVDDILSRTTRYYISTGGGNLLKDFGEGRISGINVGYSTTLFNKYIKKSDFKDYNINYLFYIKEANKIVDVIEYNQRNPSLFDE